VARQKGSLGRSMLLTSQPRSASSVPQGMPASVWALTVVKPGNGPVHHNGRSQMRQVRVRTPPMPSAERITRRLTSSSSDTSQER